VAAGESWKAIAEKLPGRCGDKAMARAKRLGLKRGEQQVEVGWREAEDEIIRAGVAAGEGSAEIAERLPGRTMKAVEHRRTALKIGVGRGEPRVCEPWTEAEDAALRESFASGKTWKEIAEDFPGRTQSAVSARGINWLGLKRQDSGGAV
jgi:hypothetical protein